MNAARWGIAVLLAFAATPPLAIVHATAAKQKKAGAELAELSKKLKDPNEKERRAAVQGLAKLATPAAWDLVIDALKDASPMVADEAELQLGDVTDAAVMDDLFGKRGLASGDAWTRVRVAEAFGRVKAPLDATLLASHLSDKDADVRRMVAWSLDRLAHTNKVMSDPGNKALAFACLEREHKVDKEAAVRAAMLVALAAIDPVEAKPIVEKALADKEAEVRCAALLAAQSLDPQPMLDASIELAGDPALAVRRQAIENLAMNGTKPACVVLVERLEKETNLRTRWLIVEKLQALSGKKNELNPPFWKEWAEGLPDNWTSGGAKPTEKPKLDTGTSVFMGLPVLSNRVAILIDFSGSLWQKRADGKTRKEVVDKELERTLKGLPADTEFNLIPYTNDPIPWEKSVVPATQANVARALDFFVKCKATGKGNVWDAILLALSDEKVDTILMLTDGAPTGGHRWNLELMGPLLAERNRFRRIVFDAVIVDASKFLEDRWKKICEDSGGRMLPVELK